MYLLRLICRALLCFLYFVLLSLWTTSKVPYWEAVPDNDVLLDFIDRKPSQFLINLRDNLLHAQCCCQSEKGTDSSLTLSLIPAHITRFIYKWWVHIQCLIYFFNFLGEIQNTYNINKWEKRGIYCMTCHLFTSPAKQFPVCRPFPDIFGIYSTRAFIA